MYVFVLGTIPKPGRSRTMAIVLAHARRTGGRGACGDKEKGDETAAASGALRGQQAMVVVVVVVVLPPTRPRNKH